MDMENKEEILQPVNEEELEAAAGGGFGGISDPRVARYFSCESCGYVGPTLWDNIPHCPMCGVWGEFSIVRR